MAKVTGLAWTTCSVDNSSGSQEAIKNEVTDLDFSISQATEDVTGIDKSAIERLALLADFSGTLNGVHSFGANPSAFDVLKDINAGNPRTLSLTTNGKSLNNEVIFTKHDVKRGNDGKLTYSAPFVLADGTVPAWS